jgi:hypothetical protein
MLRLQEAMITTLNVGLFMLWAGCFGLDACLLLVCVSRMLANIITGSSCCLPKCNKNSEHRICIPVAQVLGRLLNTCLHPLQGVDEVTW